MPLTNDDFATLEIQRAVFHDLPLRIAATEEDPEPVLSEASTPLNEMGRQHIRAKLVDTLQSSKAYSTAFVDEVSPVPASVREYLNRRRRDEADFVARSRSYAERLFQLQTSAMSAGLLCVVGCTVNQRPSMGLMKIEREEGAQLQLSGTEGSRTFTLEMLNNLVFTKNTKLFKAALFAKTGPDPESIASSASDNQLGWMARYWLDFLGCQKEREGRVDTEAFFRTVVHALNKAEDLTPIERHDAYEALLTEMRSGRTAVSTAQFVRDHIPGGIREEVKRDLREAGVSLHFDKDTADIKSSLKRRVFQTKNNIQLIVPTDSAELVQVGDESLTVNDPLVRVGRD